MQRGNEKVAREINRTEERFLSVQTYMELLQCTKNKSQHKYVKDFLSSCNFVIPPLTENIGHRASIYVEEYTIPYNLRTGDAIIAATATENNEVLVSSNTKHFKPIKDLSLKIFKP